MLLALIMGVSSTFAYSPIVPFDSTFYKRYPYIRIVTDSVQPQQVTDSAFNRQSGRVMFPVSKYVLPKDASLLRELERDVIPQLNRDSMQLQRVMLRGSASPEGPYEFNKMLGRERGKALLGFLTDRLTMPESDGVLQMDNDIEDYRTLCVLMLERNDADYLLVQRLCDKYYALNDIAGLKARLKKERHGQLWARLLRVYFPQLRAARVLLFFRRYEPEQPEPPKPEAPVEVVAPMLIDADDKGTAQMVVAVKPEEQAAGEDVYPLARRELLSVKTNLLFYALYMPGYNRWCPIPNIAVEYYPTRGHFTFGASFDMPWWQHYHKHKFFQLRNYQVEARYYLRSGDILKREPGKGAAFRGLYLQGYANAGLFGICFDADRGWVGEGFGAGVGAGYVLPLSKRGHWRLEFQLQAGFFTCKYDPYQYENLINTEYHDDRYYYRWTQRASLFKRRQYKWTWVGPTRLGITLSYDLLYRRVKKNGMSFKAWEDRP